MTVASSPASKNRFNPRCRNPMITSKCNPQRFAGQSGPRRQLKVASIAAQNAPQKAVSSTIRVLPHMVMSSLMAQARAGAEPSGSGSKAGPGRSYRLAFISKTD